VIRAPRALVFRHFTEPARFASWWGAGSTIDARPGGALRIVYPDGSIASGRVLELHAPQLIAMTYGYEGAGKPIPPGGSRLTFRLAEVPEGTRLQLLHEVADPRTRDLHIAGWRYQLALFANVAAAEAHAGAPAAAARWFAAWNEDDPARRAELLGALVHPEILFQDAHGLTRGRDELLAHVAAVKQQMTGLVLEPQGAARHCQGTLLADWLVKRPDGSTLARGTNVFDLAPDGRFTRVVGLWGPP
jgi:uncharacterized protein YndB with AHSA1/START domain